MFDTAKEQEKAVLVAVITGKQSEATTNDYLGELSFLAETTGLLTLKTFTQRLDRPDLRTYVGKGRLEDVAVFVRNEGVKWVIFDDELSPSQTRNLNDVFNQGKLEPDVRILDRSSLILDIFAQRAKTVQAKTQVELAQYQYLLPRLTRMWTHLSRQQGGAANMRGPGEKEIETDRRLAKDRIAFLKEKLEKIDRQNQTQRKNREQLVRVALVGYTNVGKSTLMQRIAKADVFAENKLFATVDSTVRKVVLDNIPFLLTDTVGFIRKLPTKLIESFKSTLDEVREADILLHVVDISHPAFEDQMQVVNKTLADIGANNKPVIIVFNKMDLFDQQPTPDEDETSLTRDEQLVYLKNTYLDKDATRAVFVSATLKENLEELRETMLALVKDKHYAIFPNEPAQAY